MGKVQVLVEVPNRSGHQESFGLFSSGMVSEEASLRQGEAFVADLGGMGLEVLPDFAPVPLFGNQAFEPSISSALMEFSTPETNPDREASSLIIPCEIERSQLDKLDSTDGIKVWPNSPMTLFGCNCSDGQSQKSQNESYSENYQWMGEADHFGIDDLNQSLFDLATSAAGLDCRPFRSAVSFGAIRTLLGVQRIWFDGFRGQNIVVGIIDDGINGRVYPVIGGFKRPFSPRPGSAPITSHGSMCAADILVAAPQAKLYDYPFLGQPSSGGALAMFQEVLGQRRIDGTPHLTNNSYGFVGIPPRQQFPTHEIHDINHPVHRKVREVVASGCPSFFAAGNCGIQCPSGACHPSGIGPGQSIHASNSLNEVITVAAVNSRHDRIGYSSQGEGMFERQKPDIAAYSHFYGNLGPGRPGGGGINSFDSGTSAATPVACGVAALLLSAFPNISPAHLKQVLIQSAINIGSPGWDTDTGFGVVNAAAAYRLIVEGRV